MFRELVLLSPVLLILVSGMLVTTPNGSLGDTFRQCLISQAPGSLGHCMGVGLINRLQSLDGSPEFDLVDGVTLSRSADQEYRDGSFNFAEGDPSSFRSLLDTFSHVFSRRNLEWNMNFLYPGLMMRVAPSGGPGGQLEFALDAHREAVNVQSLKEAGTGRLLARQFLVPLLLGFKFNVASLLPVLFGLLALIAKKAVVLSKLALVITSAFGIGSLLFGQGGQYQQNYHGGGYLQGFGGGVGGHHGIRYPEYDYHTNHFYREKTEEPLPDQLNLYGDISKSFRSPEEQQSIGRNFAWSETEKKTEEKQPNRRSLE